MTKFSVRLGNYVFLLDETIGKRLVQKQQDLLIDCLTDELRRSSIEKHEYANVNRYLESARKVQKDMENEMIQHCISKKYHKYVDDGRDEPMNEMIRGTPINSVLINIMFPLIIPYGGRRHDDPLIKNIEKEIPSGNLWDIISLPLEKQIIIFNKFIKPIMISII